MMRSGWLLGLTFLCLACAAATGRAEGPEPGAVVVTLKAEAEVGVGELLLGQVAEILAEDSVRAKLAAVSLGPAPAPGASRAITVGQVRLRMRQAGIRPEAIAIYGPQQVTVQAGSRAARPAPAAADSLANNPSNETPDVRHGDRLTVTVACGLVEVVMEGIAIGQGRVGEVIRVRIPGTGALVEGRLDAARCLRIGVTR